MIETIISRDFGTPPSLATDFVTLTIDGQRVTVAAGVVFDDGDGENVRDLAVVSLRRWDSSVSPHALAILDITIPEAPVLLNEIDISRFGIPQSLKRRSDGLLALGTSTDVILLDPSLLALPLSSSGEIPAVVGVLEGQERGACLGPFHGRTAAAGESARSPRRHSAWARSSWGGCRRSRRGVRSRARA